jgi:hypothetical protein
MRAPNEYIEIGAAMTWLSSIVFFSAQILNGVPVSLQF